MIIFGIGSKQLIHNNEEQSRTIVLGGFFTEVSKRQACTACLLRYKKDVKVHFGLRRKGRICSNERPIRYNLVEYTSKYMKNGILMAKVHSDCHKNQTKGV